MNQKGLLSTWNDAKGFGFITPEPGGERVFAHISAYAGNGRPAANRRVIYSQAKDKQGRPRAARFQYAGAAGLGASVAPGVWLALLIAAGVIGGLGALFAWSLVPAALPAAYLAVSLLTFVMYAMDKGAAENGKRRVPEQRLHFFELLCGWPGALVGQQFFRHKTRKVSFQVGFWLNVVLNLAALGWLLVCPQAEFARRALGMELLVPV